MDNRIANQELTVDIATSEPERVRDRIDISPTLGARPAPIDSKLQLADKLQQKSILSYAQRVASGQRLDAPLVVDLDPTTFCDLACPECISSGVLNSGQFSAGRFEALARELVDAGVKGVILIGGGEPLIHRNIGEVIEILGKAGVALGLVTNGTLINRHMATLARYLSWVRVSIDAGSVEIYDRFRPSGRKESVFPVVIENMKILAANKSGRLGYSFLLMQRHDEAGNVVETNYDDVLKAGRLAKSIGCDYFEIKAALDSDHYLVGQDDSDISRVEEQLRALSAIEDDDFKILRSSTWIALQARGELEQRKDYHICPMSEMRATITPNGVYTCAYHRGHEIGRIGDVNMMSLKEMWAQADTHKVDPAKDCRFHCARHPSNKFMESLSAGATPTTTDDYDFFI